MDKFIRSAALAAVAAILTACGGGSGSSTTTSGSGAQAVTGVSMPSTVSVVTAKNAN